MVKERKRRDSKRGAICVGRMATSSAFNPMLTPFAESALPRGLCPPLRKLIFVPLPYLPSVINSALGWSQRPTLPPSRKLI